MRRRIRFKSDLQVDGTIFDKDGNPIGGGEFIYQNGLELGEWEPTLSPALTATALSSPSWVNLPKCQLPPGNLYAVTLRSEFSAGASSAVLKLMALRDQAEFETGWAQSTNDIVAAGETDSVVLKVLCPGEFWIAAHYTGGITGTAGMSWDATRIL